MRLAVPKIQRLKITNFRSIKSIDIRFDAIGILVGNNDCGKSNIFRALNLFFNGKTDGNLNFDFNVDFNRYIATNRRAPEISIELEIALPKNYHLTNGEIIVWKKTWRRNGLWASKCGYQGYRRKDPDRATSRLIEVNIPAKSNVHSLLSKIEFEYIPAIRSADYLRNLRGRIYGVISQVTEANFRERSRDFEKAISENVDDLIEGIDTDLEEKTSLKLPNDLSDIFKSLDFLSGEKSISLNQRGDGIKGRYIPLILKFMSDKKSALQKRGAQPFTFIWAYEEPENNLEYTRARELSDYLCEISNNGNIQVLITTHSPIFYNLKNANVSCSVSHIKNSTMSGTQLIPSTPDTLDIEMGILPLIAPYILEAQQKIDALKTHITHTEEQLHNDNKHLIFVEGPTEYKIYKKLIDYHIPKKQASKFLLVSPPDRAGAHYVANMLTATDHKTKHKLKNMRKIALGIVDKDQEGDSAKIQFYSKNKNAKYSFLESNCIPHHLENLFKNGYIIPICLEELLRPEQWEIAEQNGWLIDRKTNSLFSEVLIEKAVHDNVSPLHYLEEDWGIFCRKMPNPDYKMDWMNHLTNLSENDFKYATYPIILAFKEHLNKIGVPFQI